MKYFALRLVTAVPTAALVLLLTFLLLELVPGDPARVVTGENATPEQVEVARHRLGLDEPFAQRASDFVIDVFRGDLGESLQNQQPVTKRIGATLPVTLSLTAVSVVFSLVIAIPFGALAALFQGRWLDRAVAAVSSALIAIPPFITGLVLVIVFALKNDLFPAGGYVAFRDSPAEWLRSLVLPAFALSLTSAAELARQIRSSMVETLDQSFVRTVRAKGMSPKNVIAKHCAKNAAIPVVTVFGLQIGRILSGAVVIELIFALPGFGTLAYQAVLGRDLPLIQGVVLVSALAVIICNLVVDVSYGYFNPRLRTER